MSSIILAFPAARARIRDGIRDVLLSSGFEDVSTASNASEALQEMNEKDSGILVCCAQLPDLYYREILYCMPPFFQLLLLDSAAVISTLREADVIALPLPVHARELVSTLRMMEQSLQRTRIAQLQQGKKPRSGKDRRQIDAAKELLMERNRMSEEEAYRYLQKTSMDTGRTMIETARMILLFS